jgi:hypothetical protein
MQTVVKEGVNVETRARKVSATTDLFLHSTAGPGARADRPHTRSHLLPPSSSTLFQTLQTWRLFSRPVIQIAFLRMAIRSNSCGLRNSSMKISHANRMRGILGYVMHHRTHKMWKACVRVRCGAQKPNLLLSNIPVYTNCRVHIPCMQFLFPCVRFNTHIPVVHTGI